MCTEQIDPRLLNRAGLAWFALNTWWHRHPEDEHPTNGQLVDQLAAIGQAVDERTVARGIKDLGAAGLLTIETVRHHQVGRRLTRLTSRPSTRDNSVTPDNSGAPVLSRLTLNVDREDLSKTQNVGRDNSVTPDNSGAPVLSRLTLNVDREDLSKTQNVGRDNSVTPDNSGAPAKVSTHPDLAPPPPPPAHLGSILGRLNLAIGGEMQPQLPLTDGDPRPRAKGTELRLMQVLGQLETATADPATAVQWAIGRLKGEYGPGYEGFYRKVCESVRTGKEPLGKLLDAVEEAGREGVKNRGASFLAACRRTMPSMQSGMPDPGPNRQAHPGSGGNRGIPDSDSSQLTKSAG